MPMPNNERVVNRYELTALNKCVIRLPNGSRILGAGSHGMRLFVFAEIDPNPPTEYAAHTIYSYKTGSVFHTPPQARFLNSVFVPPDSAFHVYVDDDTETA
jgi:hypothetical protein